MAELSGDVLVVPTLEGIAEAVRMGQGEAGQSRWCVKHSWGTGTFYGTAEQAISHIRQQAGMRGLGASLLKRVEGGQHAISDARPPT